MSRWISLTIVSISHELTFNPQLYTVKLVQFTNIRTYTRSWCRSITRPGARDTWRDTPGWMRRSRSVWGPRSLLGWSRRRWAWCRPSQSSAGSVTSGSAARWGRRARARTCIWPSSWRPSPCAPCQSAAGNRGHPGENNNENHDIRADAVDSSSGKQHNCHSVQIDSSLTLNLGGDAGYMAAEGLLGNESMNIQGIIWLKNDVCPPHCCYGWETDQVLPLNIGF